MRKEILIAITLGIFVGMIVAFGIWRANSAFNGNANKDQEPQITNSDSDVRPESLNLTIDSPDEYDVVTSSPVVVSAIATPLSWVVVSSENEDFIFQVGEGGTFEQEVNPIGGVNQDIIASFDEKGSKIQQILTYVFSTEFEVQEPADEDEAQEETDAVREKVQERLAQSRQSPKAFIGSITDKTEDSIQIRDVSGEIKLISVTEELLDFVQIDDATTEVSYSDVAIGDFIVAMGFTDGNEVLDARRVLLTSPLEAPTRGVIFGEVISTERRQAVIMAANNEEVTLDFPTRWKGPEVEDLEEGMNIIAVLVEDDDEPVVRTVAIVSTEPSPAPNE